MGVALINTWHKISEESPSAYLDFKIWLQSTKALHGGNLGLKQDVSIMDLPYSFQKALIDEYLRHKRFKINVWGEQNPNKRYYWSLVRMFKGIVAIKDTFDKLDGHLSTKQAYVASLRPTFKTINTALEK